MIGTDARDAGDQAIRTYSATDVDTVLTSSPTGSPQDSSTSNSSSAGTPLPT